MNTYSKEVRHVLCQLTPLTAETQWQYTDEQIISMFETVIRELHEGTDERSRIILYHSNAWIQRETNNIYVPILLTARLWPWFRRWSLGNYFASLGQTSDFDRWFGNDEPFWDDDSIDVDSVD